MRLLAVGGGGLATGYSRVFGSLLSELARSLEVVHFAPNLLEEGAKCSYPVLPRQIRGDIFGREALPSLLDRYDPDAVLLLHDPPFWSIHEEALLRRGTFNVFYCPIEWDTLHPGILRSFATLDRAVLFTEFGLGVVERAFADEPEKMPSLAVIPHGIDIEAFHPLAKSIPESRAVARRRLFPDRPELRDAFIVLNANRNCPRKRIDATLRGFALFARDRPDAWLYLHMGMKDSGCDVLALAAELGIRDRLLTTTAEPERPKIEDEELNVIYNACDVGLNTSTGEGWGLVAFEHAATGAPQIVPNHSACRELWEGHGVLFECGEFEIEAAVVAQVIEALYRDPDLRERLSERVLTYTREERFRWSAIAGQWRDLLSVVATPSASSFPSLEPR
ncbi:MAG TPA: glycosyltransferase family 4 protein [Fimbriimonadaceae bacterium]|nr:glycosyltransferase family 4 protein [Fimbriimonadaceae bacterium]